METLKWRTLWYVNYIFFKSWFQKLLEHTIYMTNAIAIS